MFTSFPSHHPNKSFEEKYNYVVINSYILRRLTIHINTTTSHDRLHPPSSTISQSLGNYRRRRFFSSPVLNPCPPSSPRHSSTSTKPTRNCSSFPSVFNYATSFLEKIFQDKRITQCRMFRISLRDKVNQKSHRNVRIVPPVPGGVGVKRSTFHSTSHPFTEGKTSVSVCKVKPGFASRGLRVW